MRQLDTMEILAGVGSRVRPCLIENAYYKHEIGPDGKPIQFMSGLPLPLDEKGRLDGVTFKNCDFHPCCPDVRKLGAVVIGWYMP